MPLGLLAKIRKEGGGMGAVRRRQEKGFFVSDMKKG